MRKCTRNKDNESKKMVSIYHVNSHRIFTSREVFFIENEIHINSIQSDDNTLKQLTHVKEINEDKFDTILKEQIKLYDDVPLSYDNSMIA